MKTLVFAVSLIAVATTVQGRNPWPGPPHSNKKNHGHRKEIEMSNPSSLKEDELLKNRKLIIVKPIIYAPEEYDYEYDYELLPAKDQCKEEQGKCIENRGYCDGMILILSGFNNTHCCCCVKQEIVTTPTPTPTPTPASTPTPTPPITTPPIIITGCPDGFCVENGTYCDGIITMERNSTNETCCCCQGILKHTQKLPWVKNLDNEEFVPFPNESDMMNWYSARAFCRSYGLDLYRPNNILYVADYLTQNTTANYYWFGAKGNSSNQVWFNGVGLSSADPWIVPEQYYTNGTNDCLACYTYPYEDYQDYYYNRDTVLFSGTDSCTDYDYFNPICGYPMSSEIYY